MTQVTAHAALRYQERVNPRLTIAEATAAIHTHDRAIEAAIDFRCHVVRIAEKVKLIIEHGRVKTVIPCDRPWSGHRYWGEAV